MDACSRQPFELKRVKRSRCLRSRDCFMSFTIKAFKILGTPGSLEEIFDLFRSDKRIVIWVGDHCFLHDDKVLRPKDYLFEFTWSLSHKGTFYICSKSLEEANGCLGTLFEPANKSSERSMLRWSFPASRKTAVCPFSCEILEKFIVQNQKGTSGFSNMTFTPFQSRTLATSGKQTHLMLDNCRFQDDGKTFMDTSMAKQNCGPTKLQIRSFFPLGGSKLHAFMNKLDELSLFNLHSLSAELCRAVVSAELHCLRLSWVSLGDEAEQTLIQNIRQGRGPKGISIHPRSFGSRERFLNFCNALADQDGHQYLETLELISDLKDPDLEVESALLAAWQGKLGLTSFTLAFFQITEAFWNSLLEQVALQPSLRKLIFDCVRIQDCTATFQERTEQLANVVLENGRIEQMKFTYGLFDFTVWRERVVPALQHNEHRERFLALAKIDVSLSRKAILAAATRKVCARPSLLYALLHQNLDIIVSPCKKRDSHDPPLGSSKALTGI